MSRCNKKNMITTAYVTGIEKLMQFLINIHLLAIPLSLMLQTVNNNLLISKLLDPLTKIP